jgi:orotidine-5'-phosphate decarboxylase
MFFGGSQVNTQGNASTSDPYSQGQGFGDQIKDLGTAFKDYVFSATELLKPMENAVKAFTHMEDSALAIQKSMGGFAYSYINAQGKLIENTSELRNKLMDTFTLTQDIGATFEDAAKSMSALAAGMGRMVNPSVDVLTSMVELSQSTGLSNEEVGEMVTSMVRFNGNQKEATTMMSSLALEARKVGLNTKGYMKEVSSNMKLMNGFGFKTGIEGVKSMAKEALLLRSSIEKIGAAKFQAKILTPEGAIQAAAGMQMLGGAMGKLSDPFQLMHMAQTDMAGLQKELVNATKSSFAFNKSTGGFEASTQDLYKLREQADITGANFDELVEAGREAAKMDFISSKFDLSGLDDSSKGVLASLAQIDKSGKVTVDLPGYEEGNQSLEDMMKDPEFVKKLKEYNDQSLLSEKQIAQAQMSLTETQAKDVNIIKNAVVLGLDKNQRASLEETIRESNNTAKSALTEASKDIGKEVGATMIPAISALGTGFNTAINQTTGYGNPEDPLKQGAIKGVIRNTGAAISNTITGATPTISGNDMFLSSSGRAPQLMSEGTLYKGIVGDDVAIGTNLTEAFNKSGKLNEIMSSMASTNNTGGGNASVDGKIDININVTGAVSGDKAGDVEKMFSDPRIQKQLMDTVLYKLDSYKRQQGVLSK